MPLDPPSFDRTDYAHPAELVDPNKISTAPAQPDPAFFARGLVFGLGGALAGAIIYSGFVGLTHITIGYLAILVAYLVAKAMSSGSRGQGGLYHQTSALLLTYAAVSAAHSAMLWWAVHQEGKSIP